MYELLLDPSAWASLLTLTILEIVLGIDNIVFLSITTDRLPPEQAKIARRLGLVLALVMRIGLLLSIAWIIGLTSTIFTFQDFPVSWRDIVLVGGGLFLLFKGTSEIHGAVEGEEEGAGSRTTTFFMAIIQIVILDVIFSLDSVITAVGMADHVEIMVAAIIIAIIVMIFAAEAVSAFITSHPTVKMLALGFLLLIGMTLVADGLHFHIPRGYIYFAIAFSIAIESLNILARRKRK